MPGPSEGVEIGTALERARALIRSARFEEASTSLTGVLQQALAPEQRDDAWYLLAVARRFNNDLNGALGLLERLTRARPEHARAWQEKGHALLSLGRPAKATDAFARAVELNGTLIASWRALAGLHDRAGHRATAERARQRLARLQALPAELLAASDLANDRRLHDAERICRRFLAQHGHHPEGMRLLADIATQLRIYDDAEFLLESCVELYPLHVDARIDYLRLLIRKAKFAKALEQAKIVLRHRPDDAGVQTSLATALVGLGRLDAGITAYRKILAGSRRRPGVHLLLGHALKARGDFDQAVASYRRAYGIRPDYGDAYWSLANTKTYRFTDTEIDAMRRHKADESLNADDRAHFCFAAGKAFEDRGDYAESFACYERGNALKRAMNDYDPARTTRMVDAQVDQCTKELFERRGGLGYAGPDPIFIVGLPRAGSTLLEQILASHSMVDGTLELHNILTLVQRLRGRGGNGPAAYPRILHELDDSYFRRFGEQYIRDTRVYRGKAPLFVDKMPNNFFHIGLIRLILPRAKVIDARRHPLACCFSGFKQLFGEGQDFTYGQHEIGRYYRDYVRLMDHWDRVLPGFVLRVMHEDVVDDLEGEVKRLLRFCGLPFEPGCVAFHETSRSVRTPSSEQVRQPIYRSGLDQWRRYAGWLDPLREALGPEILRRYPERVPGAAPSRT